MVGSRHEHRSSSRGRDGFIGIHRRSRLVARRLHGQSCGRRAGNSVRSDVRRQLSLDGSPLRDRHQSKAADHPRRQSHFVGLPGKRTCHGDGVGNRRPMEHNLLCDPLPDCGGRHWQTPLLWGMDCRSIVAARRRGHRRCYGRKQRTCARVDRSNRLLVWRMAGWLCVWRHSTNRHGCLGALPSRACLYALILFEHAA